MDSLLKKVKEVMAGLLVGYFQYYSISMTKGDEREKDREQPVGGGVRTHTTFTVYHLIGVVV